MKLFPLLILSRGTEMKNAAVRQTVRVLFEQDSWPPIAEEASKGDISVDFEKDFLGLN